MVTRSTTRAAERLLTDQGQVETGYLRDDCSQGTSHPVLHPSFCKNLPISQFVHAGLPNAEGSHRCLSLVQGDRLLDREIPTPLQIGHSALRPERRLRRPLQQRSLADGGFEQFGHVVVFRCSDRIDDSCEAPMRQRSQR